MSPPHEAEDDGNLRLCKLTRNRSNFFFSLPLVGRAGVGVSPTDGKKSKFFAESLARTTPTLTLPIRGRGFLGEIECLKWVISIDHWYQVSQTMGQQQSGCHGRVTTGLVTDHCQSDPICRPGNPCPCWQGVFLKCHAWRPRKYLPVLHPHTPCLSQRT